jgi:hypothetical protein
VTADIRQHDALQEFVLQVERAPVLFDAPVREVSRAVCRGRLYLVVARTRRREDSRPADLPGRWAASGCPPTRATCATRRAGQQEHYQ